MSGILSLHNVSVHYGKFAVLKNISVSFSQGTIGLLGPNGAGKSTLIKTILGLLPITTGNIQLFGTAIEQKGFREMRQKIGYVPEGDCYLPGISAVQFVAFLAELTGIETASAMKRAHEVLEYVGLGEERYRKLEDLSFGQRSRVKLAQALCHNIELLILDEPTDGMDPAGKENFFHILRNIQKNTSLSILLASHHLEDVEALCSEIILLYNGQVLSVKKLEELHTGFENTYILELGPHSDTFAKLCSEKGFLTKQISSNQILVANVHDPRILFPLLLKAQAEILSMGPWRPTLESLFIDLIQHSGQATASV